MGKFGKEYVWPTPSIRAPDGASHVGVRLKTILRVWARDLGQIECVVTQNEERLRRSEAKEPMRDFWRERWRRSICGISSNCDRAP